MVVSFVTTADIIAYVEDRLDEEARQDVEQVIRDDPRARSVAEHAHRHRQKRPERNLLINPR